MTEKVVEFKAIDSVTEQEEPVARALIEKELGFAVPKMCGYHLALKVYVRAEDVHTFTDENGVERSIYLPDNVTSGDRYRSCVGLVIAVGPEAYQGKRFEGKEPWCRVGDWVIFPRNEGFQVTYQEVPLQMIPDDRILAVVSSPEAITF